MKNRFTQIQIFSLLFIPLLQFTAFADNMPSTSPVAVSIATNKANAGEFITDSQGKSLYAFDLDKDKQSNCTGQCSELWIPLTVSSGQVPTVTGDAQSSLLGTIQRNDGTTQVTYNGQPLYYYSFDKMKGDTRGQGVNSDGGNWFLVKPEGAKLIPAIQSGETSNATDALLSTLDSRADHGGHNGGGHDGGNHNGGDHNGGGHDGGYHNGCYYWGNCSGGGYTGGYNYCGTYTCYYNGSCCDYCGSCYSN